MLYGTLLGAIREKDFISHDEDADLFMHFEDFEIFKSYLFDLRDIGFEVARYDSRGFLSLIKQGEYIDIYFFKMKNDVIGECCGNFILNQFINDTVSYNFLGEDFLIPRDYVSFFELEYGSNWATPIEYIPKIRSKAYNKIRLYIKRIIPKFLLSFYHSYKSNKSYISFQEKYNNKMNGLV